MFGKLFGCYAVIRSGRLEDDSVSAVSVLDRLLELHGRKGWLRETTSEAILYLLSRVPMVVVEKEVVSKLRPLVAVADGSVGRYLEDMAAWQLVLISGLQDIVKCQGTHHSVVSALSDILPEALVACVASLDLVTPTLLAATAGFPKVIFSYFIFSTCLNLLNRFIACGIVSWEEFSQWMLRELFLRRGTCLLNISFSISSFDFNLDLWS